MQIDLLAIGDIKLDAFISIPDKIGETFTRGKTEVVAVPNGRKTIVDDIDLQIAGTAPNVATGLRRLGFHTGVYAEMAKGPIHIMAVDELMSRKVATDFIRARRGLKPAFAAVLNHKGESTQLVLQSSGEYRLPHLGEAPKWVHLSELGDSYEALFKQLVKLKKRHGTKISFNPGSIQIKERSDAFFALLKSADILFVNRAEAASIVKKKPSKDIKTLLSKLHDLGPDIVVITDGREGAYVYNGNDALFSPMFPGERVEATGAGDAFSTGFLGAIMNDESIEDGLKWGSVNSAQVVQFVGPVEGLQNIARIKSHLKRQRDYKTKTI
ncbi:MAG: PfkB family carbohydrate kinase [bacterium]|nr:PfkB family carbohydrate kinase [bacterium]MDA1024385.1 PfkB family carbohydrate kinase [bacterium]